MDKTEEQESFTTELEASLKEDAGGGFRDSVRSAIAEQKAKIESELRRGVPPKEYNTLNTYKQGLDAADTVLDRFWDYYNKS